MHRFKQKEVANLLFSFNFQHPNPNLP